MKVCSENSYVFMCMGQVLISRTNCKKGCTQGPKSMFIVLVRYIFGNNSFNSFYIKTEGNVYLMFGCITDKHNTLQ